MFKLALSDIKTPNVRMDSQWPLCLADPRSFLAPNADDATMRHVPAQR